MKRITTTLCIVHQPPRVLLGMKRRGFGAGKWNGFGGKVRMGEAIGIAARRELNEETGITAKDLTKMGIIEFEFLGNQEVIQMHVFKVTEFGGETVETEEMAPKWFHVNKIPFDQMWPDDRFWFPLLLSGEKFRARFVFDQALTRIVESKILRVRTLS